MIHGGVSFTIDANGNLSFKPKVGLGIGELAALKFGKSVFSISAIEIGSDESDDDSSTQQQEAYERWERAMEQRRWHDIGGGL